MGRNEEVKKPLQEASKLTIDRKAVVAEICSALNELASGYEETKREEWDAFELSVIDKLSKVVRVDEAAKLVKIVMTPRALCRGCTGVYPTYQVSTDSLCTWCSADDLANEAAKAEQLRKK